MNTRRILTVGLSLAVLVTASPGRYVLAEHHRQRAPVWRSLPGWEYAEDHQRAGETVIAVADPAQPVTWLEDEILRPSGANLDHNVTWPLQKKKFHFPATSLSVDGVRLDQVGLAVYDTGLVRCTGKVTHTGGPDGSRSSNCIMVQVRAYSGQPQAQPPLINSSVVWQSPEHRIRARRNRPVTISLVPESSTRVPELRRSFDEITHLEVEFHVQRDR